MDDVFIEVSSRKLEKALEAISKEKPPLRAVSDAPKTHETRHAMSAASSSFC
jgi:hypothetical protein